MWELEYLEQCFQGLRVAAKVAAIGQQLGLVKETIGNDESLSQTWSFEKVLKYLCVVVKAVFELVSKQWAKHEVILLADLLKSCC